MIYLFIFMVYWLVSGGVGLYLVRKSTLFGWEIALNYLLAAPFITPIAIVAWILHKIDPHADIDLQIEVAIPVCFFFIAQMAMIMITHEQVMNHPINHVECVCKK